MQLAHLPEEALEARLGMEAENLLEVLHSLRKYLDDAEIFDRPMAPEELRQILSKARWACGEARMMSNDELRSFYDQNRGYVTSIYDKSDRILSGNVPPEQYIGLVNREMKENGELYSLDELKQVRERLKLAYRETLDFLSEDLSPDERKYLLSRYRSALATNQNLINNARAIENADLFGILFNEKLSPNRKFRLAMTYLSSHSSISDGAEMRDFIKNAGNQLSLFERNQISSGKPLTKTQMDMLRKEIGWLHDHTMRYRLAVEETYSSITKSLGKMPLERYITAELRDLIFTEPIENIMPDPLIIRAMFSGVNEDAFFVPKLYTVMADRPVGDIISLSIKRRLSAQSGKAMKDYYGSSLSPESRRRLDEGLRRARKQTLTGVLCYYDLKAEELRRRKLTYSHPEESLDKQIKLTPGKGINYIEELREGRGRLDELKRISRERLLNGSRGKEQAIAA